MESRLQGFHINYGIILPRTTTGLFCLRPIGDGNSHAESAGSVVVVGTRTDSCLIDLGLTKVHLWMLSLELFQHGQLLLLVTRW